VGAESEPRLRVVWTDPVTGRKGFAVIDRTVNGLAGGGTRMRAGVSLDEVERDPGGSLISPERVIPIPTVVLDGRDATDFRAGRVVPLAEPPAEKHVFVRDPARALVGVGETVGALLAPRKVFL